MNNNDTIKKTLIVAVSLCLVCSALISFSAVELRDLQEANKTLDKQNKILSAAGLLKEGSDVSELFKSIDPKIVNLETGKFDFDINRPRIAVLGLNPHSGDGGVIGNEEDQIFYPVIEELRQKGHLVFGPYAADSFFGNQRYLNFDAILSTYHDQGLIPFKTLTFGEGINFTAGLSKVRTSPDHGTAFEIAGKGIAQVGSFRSAMYTARRIFSNRKKNKNIL